MDNTLKQRQLNFYEAAESLGVTPSHFLQWLSDGKIRTFFWSGYERMWRQVVKETLLRARLKNDKYIKLEVHGDRDGEFFSEDKLVGLERLVFDVRELNHFKSSYLNNKLIIMKANWTKIRFGGKVIDLNLKQAEIAKLLYDRSTSLEPALHESEIFNLCPTAQQASEHRVRQVFRTKLEIYKLLFVKTKLATYKFTAYS